jgi:hypothetical protein
MQAVLSATIVTGVALAAQLTSITYTPNPIILGGGCTYTANDDGTAPNGAYKWEYRCTSGGTGNWVTAASTKKTYFIYEGYPGNYEVQCTAPYPKGDSTVSVNVTIAPANADHVISGLNNPAGVGGPTGTPGGMVPPTRRLILFQIMVGSTPAGPYVAGTLQERVRRPDLGFDSGWINGDPADLFVEAGKVNDYKVVNVAPPSTLMTYDTLPNGYVIDDFYQQFRIVTIDSCGNQVMMYLTEHHFTKTKSGYRQWSLSE